MEHTEKTTTRGLPMTTWLLIFCIFNLVVTLALFGAIMRRSHMTAGYSQNGYQTMMQGNRRNMMQGVRENMQRRGAYSNNPNTVTDTTAVTGENVQSASGTNQ